VGGEVCEFDVLIWRERGGRGGVWNKVFDLRMA
jgi:hypothetical protein